MKNPKRPFSRKTLSLVSLGSGVLAVLLFVINYFVSFELTGVSLALFLLFPFISIGTGIFTRWEKYGRVGIYFGLYGLTALHILGTLRFFVEGLFHEGMTGWLFNLFFIYPSVSQYLLIVLLGCALGFWFGERAEKKGGKFGRYFMHIFVVTLFFFSILPITSGEMIYVYLMLVVISLGISLLVAHLAEKKGRDYWSWFAIGLIGGVIALAVILAMNNVSNAEKADFVGYELCPFCSEKIKKEAIKCKHCHSMLDRK